MKRYLSTTWLFVQVELKHWNILKQPEIHFRKLICARTFVAGLKYVQRGSRFFGQQPNGTSVQYQTVSSVWRKIESQGVVLALVEHSFVSCSWQSIVKQLVSSVEDQSEPLSRCQWHGGGRLWMNSTAVFIDPTAMPHASPWYGVAKLVQVNGGWRSWEVVQSCHAELCGKVYACRMMLEKLGFVS